MQKEIDNIKTLLLSPSRKSNQLGIQLLESLFTPEESLAIIMEVLKIRFSKKEMTIDEMTGFEEIANNNFFIHNLYINSSPKHGQIYLLDCLLKDDLSLPYEYESSSITIKYNYWEYPNLWMENNMLGYDIVLYSPEKLDVKQQLDLAKKHIKAVLDISKNDRQKRILIDQAKRTMLRSGAQLLKEGLLSLKDCLGWNKTIEYLFLNILFTPRGLVGNADQSIDIGVYNIVDYTTKSPDLESKILLEENMGILKIRMAKNRDQLIYESKTDMSYSERLKALQEILPKLLENE